MEYRLKVYPPYYIFVSQAQCARCKTTQPVACLGASGIEDIIDGDEYTGVDDSQVSFITYLENAPEALLAAVRRYVPSFELAASQTAGTRYYANICRCGSFFGDWFLHQPDSAFFPTRSFDIDSIRFARLALTETFELKARWAQGCADKVIAAGNLAQPAPPYDGEEG